MEEAQIALEQEDLASLQIIYNIFRQKPIDELFATAMEKQVGIIVRLSLASGLLAGKFTAETTFPETDHRNYNRNGDCFNVGETFAGLEFAKGLELVEQVRALVPSEISMAQSAQRWILDHDAVSTVITGASRTDQVLSNTGVSELAPLSDATHKQLKSFYKNNVKANIRGPY